jgi:uncharacterized RDD family membrane protein YckC
VTTAGEGTRPPAGGRMPVGRPGLTWTGDGSLRPQPARAQPAQRREVVGPRGLEIATFRRRMVGFLVDQAILSGIAVALAAVIFSGADLSNSAQSDAALQRLAIAYYVVMTLYYWYFNVRGRTPGKRVVKLRLVGVDGRPPGVWRALLRAAAVQISAFFWLGYMWAAWDPQTQTWHDKWSRTWVVRESERRTVSPPPA